MKNLIQVVVIFFLAVCIGGGVVYWLKPSTNVDVRVNIDRIRDIAELATTSWTVSAQVDREFKSQGLGGKFRSDYVIARLTGTVRGRVDLNMAKIDVQDAEGDRQVSFFFPKGSILLSGIEYDVNDKDRTKIVSCAEMLPSATGRPANLGQMEWVRKLGEEKIVTTVKEMGIVNKTKENAETVLTTFVASFGYTPTFEWEKPYYEEAAKSEK